MQILDPKTGSRVTVDLSSRNVGGHPCRSRPVPMIHNNFPVSRVIDDSYLRSRNGILSWNSGYAGLYQNNTSLSCYCYCLSYNWKGSWHDPSSES